ncbi:MAG: arginine--tRNA ligase [Pseudomonadota bacterium]
MSLVRSLTDLVAAAFEAEGLDRAYGRVAPSDRPDLCQFQCNGALSAAKAAKTNPRAIGEKVAERLKTDDRFADVAVAGPGFLNLTLTDETLAEAGEALAQAGAGAAPQAEVREKIVVDYGGANVAKPLHVGHLRSAIIGESVKRIMRAVGHEVVGDVHLGDWGLQMGQLISTLAVERPELPHFDPAFEGPYPDEPAVSLAELEALYPRASHASKTDEARRDAARKATAELQAGRAGYRALWRDFVAVSVPVVRGEYGELGVVFDLWNGESDVQHLIPDLVADLAARKVSEASDGAVVVRVAREDDKKEIPPLILVTRDGSSVYATTDLATILDRKQEIGPDRALYVVDQRQAQHFEQVFRAADLAGLAAEDRLEHIGFGTMNGADGKPFKTREGGVLRLRDLIDLVHERARERIEAGGVGAELDEGERDDIAKKVGVAALKFADLSNPRTTDYIFDLDRFLSFEGKTGPYLLYALVRIKSLLRRAGEDHPVGALIVEGEPERALVLTVDAYTEAVRAAADRRMPHILCDHAFALAQSFAKFYAARRVLDEPDAALRASRLRLAAAVGDQLAAVLNLLGIDAPDRM